MTLPAFRGRSTRGEVWDIVIASSNRAEAARRGVIFAPKLRNALGTKAVQRHSRASSAAGSCTTLRTDASVDVVAALEGSTLAKNLDFAPGAGSNGPKSARSAIIPIVNGPRGKANAERQGLESAVLARAAR